MADSILNAKENRIVFGHQYFSFRSFERRDLILIKQKEKLLHKRLVYLIPYTMKSNVMEVRVFYVTIEGQVVLK